jgi:hypothetical protein
MENGYPSTPPLLTITDLVNTSEWDQQTRWRLFRKMLDGLRLASIKTTETYAAPGSSVRPREFGPMRSVNHETNPL